MDIVISFAAKVAEYTVEPIARQVGYLVLYNAKFEELTNHVKELEGARDEVKHRVEEERRSGKIIETHVQNWLDTVDLAIREANQLQEDHSHAKVRCFKWSFPNLVLWHPLGRKAAKMSKNIVQILKNMTFKQVAYLPALDGAASTYVTKGNENFESRKPIKEIVMKALRDPKTRKIGVYGLGGVGKTTLVKEVAQLAKQEKLFDVVVTANVSKTPDLKTIQGEIADQLGLRFEEETVAGRALRLYQRIMTEKTILIILDDIWKRLDLEKAGVPFRDDHNGCKLLMTSRSQDVLREMSVQEYIRLEVLNEEETWSLFKAMAGDVETEPLINQLAHQVAKRCAGLPILIVTVARSLINQDIHMWKDALRQLERTDNEEMQEIAYSALELTYNRLHGNEMKALFLLCAYRKWPFVADLFKYGMGLGIFNNTNTMESARDRFYKMISALKASCLLLEGDRSTRIITMHDVVREVAISIASRDQHMLIKYESELKEWPTKDFLRSCSQIIIRCHMRKLPEMLDCPNLKLLHLHSDDPFLTVPDSLFEGMKSLQVLDLTGFNLASLPISFRSLSSLKTLCLDQCILENMDAIEALENLEILSLLQSSMIKLPSEIGKLTHLRMLDLSNSGIEIMPPKIISSLIRLEELYLGNTSIKWEEVEEPGKPKENASLTELRELSNLTALELQIHEAWVLPRDLMFDKLEKYKIVIGDVWEWPESDILDETLKTLKLKLNTNIHLEHGLKTLIKRAENLYLDEVEGIENVLYQLNGEGFPELKHLHIQNHAMIKHIIDSVDRNHAHFSFPKLETLVVQNLNCLEKICQGPLTVNSFARLRIIKVENSIQLKYLLSFSMVKGLHQLSEIEVCRCNSMEKVVFGDGDANADNGIEFFSLHSLTLQQLQSLDSFFSYELTSPEPKRQRTENHIPFFKAQLAFPNLETLKLSSLNLNNIWEDNQRCFHKLTNLIVESCGGLKYLFSYNMMRSFPNLMKLEISDCYMMEEIIATKERSNNIVASEEVRFSKLDTIILKGMENLKTIWHNQFDTLKTLQVENCQQLMVVFPSSMQKTYNNLETLIVVCCPLVEEIFELTSNEKCTIEDTTHLRRITLRSLPELKHTWSRDPEGILRFPNLEDVCLESCENLQYLFPFSVATSCSSNLQGLQIKCCGNMKEIIAQKEGTLSTTAIFKFNQLNTLFLRCLYELKGFYASSYTLECPSLRAIDVGGCAQLNLFRTIPTSSHKLLSADAKVDVSVQQSPFLVEQVIPNLDVLRINQKEGTIILQAQAQRSVPLFTKLSILALCDYKNEDSAFPDRFLQNVNTLEQLMIERSSFKKIFLDERRANEKICMRLKKLTLNQLPELLHICEEGFQIDPVLEVLEYLDVDGCPSLLNLVPSSVTFSQLVYLEIQDCNGMVNLISSSTAGSLAKLTEMKVKGCYSLEEIIMAEDKDETINDIAFLSLEILMLEYVPRLSRFCSSKCFLRFPLLKEVVVRQCPRMKNFSEGDISTPKLRKVRTGESKKEGYWKGDLNSTIRNMFEDEVAFPNLEALKLSPLNLSNTWKDNQHYFHKLKNLIVESCGELKYLFSYNMVGSLPNLMMLEISDCYMMEEIIATKDRNNNIVASEEVGFSKLDAIILKGMENLKTIWHNQFDTLKMLQVENCQQLMVVFPSSMQKTYNNLETLIVVECPLVEEIFELISNEKCAIEDTTHLKSIILSRLPELKHTWSRDPEGILRFPNLEDVNLESCENLQYLFPLSVATSCSSHLQRLDIRRCGNMKEIIAQKEGTVSTTAIFKFNKLNTLFLRSLDNLKGFYASSHTLECPSLRAIDVGGCAQLNLFKTVSTSSHKLLTEGKSDVSGQQSPFIVEQVIPNLDVLRINQKEGTIILQAQAQRSVPLFTKLSILALCDYVNEDSAFPDWFLQNVNTLEQLMIERSSFKKIFLDERRVNEKICMRLKKLTLNQLPELLHICEEGFQIDPVLEVLEFLDVDGCPSLLNLVPSSVTFSQLVYLEIQDCNGMVNLISSSTAGSLAKLTEMKVKGCYSLEEIIMAEDKDETIHDIAFLSLEILMLECLPRLSRFCSSKCFLRFPLLKEVVVRQCPRMKNFSEGDTSTPKLRKVRTCENKKEGYWKGDLNSTIKNMFEDEVAFPNLEALKLSPLNLSNTWKDNQHCFHKLKNLIVESCGELKYLFSYHMVRSLPNLMKLEISNCHMMEEIIATKDRNNNIFASEEVRFSKLDTIILKGMENLKTIWHNQFDTLKMLQVENCQQLMVVFPSSTRKTYDNLETLIVTDCPLVEEIFEFTSNEKCAIEDTTHLKSITLRRLPELKHTWSRDPEGILRFPNLEDVNLESCENLQYLFPLSVAISCSSHLQRLVIRWCGNMKEIIAQKEGTLSTTAIFKFHQLDTLVLRSLYELKGFYASSHTFECQSLRAINVAGCAKLSLFKTVSTSSHKLLTEGKSDASVQQSPFIVEQVIPNLEWLRINQKEGTIILQAQAQRSVPLFTKLSILGLHEYENEDSAFPDWFLQNVNTLEELMIEHSYFKKIFLDERCVNEKICMQLKKLTLNQLPELLHICEEGFQIDPVLEVLEYLDVGGCPSLLSLVPSSVTFSHLVYLEVQNCNGMVNLVSSSTAISLAKLTEMKVKGCDSLEEIIMIEDGDESIHDITFLSLEILMLECLPRLTRFCSSKCFLRFPLLKEIVVRQCPHMKNFSEGDISTPKLRKVRTGENKKEGHWKGDLNSTIKNMFEDKVLDNYET